LNSFISQASQAITCNSDCQKQKTTEQLQKTYLDAQVNLATASNQVQTAQKNYVEFTEGELAYNNLNDQQLSEKAEIISGQFQNNFNEEYAKIESEINTYSSLLINLNNVKELYERYKTENVDLFDDLKNNTSDVLTNERKTYYEEQGIDNLKFWYFYFLMTVYVIFVICFAAFSFIYPSQLNWKIRLAILIGLIILPFISSYLLNLVLSFIHYIYEFMPKNTHLSM
jgi:hypothetical protein